MGAGVSAGRGSVAAERVRVHISHLIDLGKLRPGERVPSARALAATNGVSVPVVLQALKMLEASGRVVVRQGDGTRVARADADNVEARRVHVWQHRDEILQQAVLREMLEVGVARRLAEQGVPAATWRKARLLLDRAEANDDVLEVRHFDTQFHELLAHACKMPLVVDAVLRARAAVGAAFEFLDWPSDRGLTSGSEHSRLLEAIAARDADGAEAATREHLAVSTRLLDEAFAGNGSAFLSPKSKPS